MNVSYTHSGVHIKVSPFHPVMIPTAFWRFSALPWKLITMKVCCGTQFKLKEREIFITVDILFVIEIFEKDVQCLLKTFMNRK